ncbi:site-2 protease family protein [Devosia nitrariae]|uniref:Zinc metalloprotease n=1 Tax=Devosia nitrariae TaxID=2071872 RepID=A0ABQ5WD43_9HYPH|nr:site-2 protease family protein [Devosia nitrariae]GLQ57415.1 protease [Devosia nitrariae]
MGWSFPIGVFMGTVLRVHVTFFLLLAWIGGSAWFAGGPQAALESVLFIVLLFACVVLHEFGHVVAARRYGVQTPDITLLPIGGVARLERIPEKPSQEFVVAIAGPLVNVVIAAVLLLVLGGILPPESMDLDDPGVSLVARLAGANIFLVLFNLIPAFPMDGGRMLRALLAYWLGYARGTRIAATVGQVAAFGFGFLGLFGNPLLLFIALFVYLGASAEAHAAQVREVSRGLLARDAMLSRFETLAPSSRIEDAVQKLLATSQHEFPVVDDAGSLRGLVTRDDIIRGLRESQPDTPVVEIMKTDIPTVNERQSLKDAMTLMQAEARPAVAVLDAAGRLIGLITPENMGELMMVLSEDQSGKLKPRRGAPGPWVTGNE